MRLHRNFAHFNPTTHLNSSRHQMSFPLPLPPVADRLRHAVRVQGQTWSDDYRWLQNKDDPQVRKHLEAENAYTAEMMRPLEGLQTHLYEDMLARIKETDIGVPYRSGQWWYYSRTEAGKQYPIYCRKRDTLESAEDIVLDLNQLAEGHPYFALGAFELSPDGSLLAYSFDTTGFREYTLRVKHLATGQVLADERRKVRSVAWCKDGSHLFYVRENHAKRGYRLYRHALGGARDRIIYEEHDERFDLQVELTRSGAFLLLTSASATTSEVRFVDAAHPRAPWVLTQERKEQHEYYVDHRGSVFLIVTNDRGRNFRLVETPLDNTGVDQWHERIPHRDDVMLEGVDVFARHAVLHERHGGFPRLTVWEPDRDEFWTIDLPEPARDVSGGANEEFDSAVYRLVYESMVTPQSVYDCDLRTRTMTLLKQREVLGGYDPREYRSELLYANASDGTRVPISLVYRLQARRAGPQPLLLTGYGAYGIPSDVYFSSNRLALLDRGVIYAIAHVRGGGEFGKQWHDQGRMLKKRNSFTDFIAAAQALIEHGYTASGHLVIQGGSAGGLLVCAATNIRPTLFKAVVAQVPFVDVINTMLDDTLPLTTGEYEEWGNPHEPQFFKYMRSYSPYDNLVEAEYPAMLVETSLYDSQVMYWEPAKYVAKLRTQHRGGTPILLKINMQAGHGGASGRYDYLREIAVTYSFVLWQMGIGT